MIYVANTVAVFLCKSVIESRLMSTLTCVATKGILRCRAEAS